MSVAFADFMEMPLSADRIYFAVFGEVRAALTAPVILISS
jgi:hypothetical protein